jgi:hypothetical protein
MVYTIVFPEIDRISSINGGCMSQEEFRKQVVDAMNTTTETAIISQPTQNRLIDYQDDALLHAFPLQFPYGVGLPPDPSSNWTDSKNVAASKLAYLQHLQHMRIRHLHHGDFILVLHNNYKRQRGVLITYLDAKNKMGNDSFAEHVAEMGLAQLQNAITRTQAGFNVSDCISTREFLKSIDAVCKSMGRQISAPENACRYGTFWYGCGFFDCYTR